MCGAVISLCKKTSPALDLQVVGSKEFSCRCISSSICPSKTPPGKLILLEGPPTWTYPGRTESLPRSCGSIESSHSHPKKLNGFCWGVNLRPSRPSPCRKITIHTLSFGPLSNIFFIYNTYIQSHPNPQKIIPSKITPSPLWYLWSLPSRSTKFPAPNDTAAGAQWPAAIDRPPRRRPATLPAAADPVADWSPRLRKDTRPEARKDGYTGCAWRVISICIQNTLRYIHVYIIVYIYVYIIQY